MANPNTGSLYADAADGQISKSGAVWATQRAAATGDSRDKTSATVNATQVQEFGGTYYIDRGFLTFDTSSIPDGSVVTAATLYIYANSKSASGISDSLCIVESTQASATDLTTADFDAVGTTELATRIAHSSISTAAYTAFALNASGLAVIGKTGFTKLALRSARDLDNSAPGTGQYAILNVNMSEASGTSKDPYLVVEYSNDRTTSDSWAWSDTAVQSNTKFSTDAWAWSDSVATYSRSQANITVRSPGANTLLNGAQDPTSATITVDSTTGFAASGAFFIVSGSYSSRITYTGLTGTTFTGCTETHSYRSGNFADNSYVSDGETHPGFPSVTPLDTTSTPELMVSYYLRPAHNAIGGGIKFKKSTDGGQSWGSEGTILSSPVGGHGVAIGGQHVKRLKNGRLIAFWYEPVASTGAVYSYVSYSDDEGSSWSTPSLLTSPFHANYCAVGFSSYVDTGGSANATYGDLYITCYGTDDGDDSAGDDHYSRLQKITDGGAGGDWTDVSTIATMAQTAYDGYAKANGEAAIGVLPSGRWVCQLRVETHIGAGTDTTNPSRYSCYSDDAGATWTGHAMTLADVLNACTAHVMPEGWVLSQGARASVFTDFVGTWISPDGTTWAYGNRRDEEDDGTYVGFIGSDFDNVRDAFDFPNVVNAWSMEKATQQGATTYFTWFQGPPYAFDEWAWADTAAGAVVFSRTTSDSWAWSDTAAAPIARSRTTSDEWAWDDTGTIGGGSIFYRTTSDTWAWSDVAAQSTSGPLARTTSDTWAWSDAVARALAAPRATTDTWRWSEPRATSAGPMIWRRTRRSDMSAPTKTYKVVLPSGTTKTATWTSETYVAQTEAGILVVLDVTAASGTGGLTLRINAHDQASSQAVPLNSAPTAVTATGTTSYALYPFGAVAGNVTQATEFYLPRMFSISVTHGDSSSYTYSVGYCLLP